MYKILKAEHLVGDDYLMVIKAPYIARKCEPGQFLITINGEKGERIPLTICDYDRENDTVTIVFQVVGASTKKMTTLKAGDCFTDIVGPLGKPSDLVDTPLPRLRNEKIIFIAGGVGAAPVYPQVKWLYENGIECDVIIGARNKDLIILEEEMRKIAKNVYITTDDGSYGEKGVVTDVLKRLVNEEGKKYTKCIAIGPVIMMKFVALTTKAMGIPTVVSMNPIMIDGTGMCGACRLMVDGNIKFACVDGPEFDGHLVNFDLAMKRQRQYPDEEKTALDAINKEMA
ncbi:MAG: sulfide/dihydroorotate dehydrogenase-like FAD/NAD-binding protein [Candidatus Fimenecus sp.]